MRCLVVCLFLLDNGQTKQPRGGFKKRRTTGKDHKKHKGKASSPEPEENLCLLRATSGKKKLTTVVSAKEVTRFQLVRNPSALGCKLMVKEVLKGRICLLPLQAYANLLKGNLDGLKKRDKKTAKAAAAKAKKSKASKATA